MESRTSDASEFAVYGPTFLDVVMGPLDGPPVPSREVWMEGTLMCTGDAANQTIALAHLGVPTRLHSHVGVDQMGTFVDEMFVHEGVNASSCGRVGGQNVTVSLPFDGGRAMVVRRTTALPLLGNDTPACLLADVRRIGTNSGVVSSWCAHGTWVLTDTAWDETRAWDKAGLESLLLADVYTPNEEEALTYTRIGNVEDAARQFVPFEYDYVVTCGKNGVVACVDGQTLRVPVSAMNAVDTTGAGDIFSATLA